MDIVDGMALIGVVMTGGLDILATVPNVELK